MKRPAYLALTGWSLQRGNSFHLTRAYQEETSFNVLSVISNSVLSGEDENTDSVEIQQQEENLQESREDSPPSPYQRVVRKFSHHHIGWMYSGSQ